MDIKALRKIGKTLRKKILSRLEELRTADSFGKGAGGDITNPIDKRAEDIVLKEVEKLKEPITVVSEECGFKNINGGGVKLLVDPIDGSRNALSGIPVFSTSIAVVDGEKISDTRMGYVINLMSGDEFWAIRGKGSYLNAREIKTQQDDTLRVIAYEAQTPKVDIPRIIPLLSLFRRARCFGSTALDMAFLAQGAVSVFVTPSLSRSFDFVSGYLLIKESGGIVTDLDGKGIGKFEAGLKKITPLLASANENLHKRALDALRKKG
jgi:myo-inositol-1(or 4)-monophosphatase